MQNIINIDKIKEVIKDKHDKFILSFAVHIEKNTADKKLLEELSITKIKYILKGFVEEKIIDNVECNGNKIKISKNGFDKKILIATDGITLMVGDSDNIMTSDQKKVYYDIYDEGFDWTIFSLDLLDLIHIIIYDRKKALETKISSIFN